MTKILSVIVDCGDLTCDNCAALGMVALYKEGEYNNPECGLFNEDLTGNLDIAYRCDRCIQAEISN